MKLDFKPVETKSDFEQLAAMADVVWHEYFPCILSTEQIDYMVDKFQSLKAFEQQTKEGYMYFFLSAGFSRVGYIGIKLEKDKLFLSKLYIMKSFRGNGYSTQAFEFLEGLALAYQLSAIYLTVNKYNDQAIKVYEKYGFKNVKSEVTEIGSGYVMDDYVFEYEVKE